MTSCKIWVNGCPLSSPPDKDATAMAAKKIKRTITLRQCGSTPPEYKVLSLQNALEPPVGAFLTAEEVAAMIDIGWTVNVKEGKS